YLPQLLSGLGITLLVAVGSFLCGFLAAIILAPLAIYAPAPIRKAIALYVGLIRGLPELLVIFLIFYGGTVLLTQVAGRYVEVNAITA
ncbi:ABC transporter permease subunit, partial [Ochrobactrum sp. GRS2]|nr:ABC transporter permease subunit [Ochrobactrum sp. GRS2]